MCVETGTPRPNANRFDRTREHRERVGTRRGDGMDALASVRAAIRGSEITLTVSLAAAFLVYRFSRPA